MIDAAKPEIDGGWICNRCGVALKLQKIRLEYRKTIFALNLPACPGCGKVMISEDLATGKMAEAEQIMEDK